MARKNTPRPYANGKWTTSRYYSFIRSALRRASLRWPPICDIRKAARRPYKGPNKRQKFEVQCSECGGWFMQKDTQIDHIIPAGPLQDYSDLPGFVERLFCEADGLRLLCLGCHQKRTNAEREARNTHTHNDT